MEMAGYRRVNYYELCRLCTASEGTRMHIFREEGRRRGLPNKIQTCLPLSVQEEDSLPKIICSNCVEKLENYYEFRESCINAEAMLESYFTSLKYSDDLSREGKVSVYVKEDTNKKKDDISLGKQKPVSSQASTQCNVSTSTNVSAATESVALPPIPSAIQIFTDTDVNRLSQFKVQVQGGVPSLVPAFPAMQIPNMPHVKSVNVSHDGTQTTQADTASSQQTQPTPVMTAVTLTQPHDFFAFNSKERYRAPLTQISDSLKMKNINIIDASLVEQLGSQTTVTGPTGMQFRIDPEQLQQLMTSSSSLQFNLNSMLAKTETRRDEKEDEKPEHDILKFEEEHEANIADDGMVGSGGEVSDNDGQNFECEMCNKVFRRKEHLLQHKKSHSGQRPFACSLCLKAFSRKEHLLRHKVSHTGQKLYTCDVCQKNFSRKDNLHKHKKTHGINGQYVCETCGKSFVVKHYYAIHRASHAKEAKQSSQTSFRCDQCPKSFNTKSSLESHRQRHRAKIKQEPEVATQEEHEESNQQAQQHHEPVQQQQQQPTIIASFPMAAINHQSLLPPNILHTGGNVLQIGNTSYVCTAELLDQYRRLHAS